MGLTKLNEIRAPQSRAKIVTDLPTTPSGYYGNATNDVDSTEWRGGEICYLSTDNRIYIQTATSGTTATWKRLLEAFVAA